MNSAVAMGRAKGLPGVMIPDGRGMWTRCSTMSAPRPTLPTKTA